MRDKPTTPRHDNARRKREQRARQLEWLTANTQFRTAEALVSKLMTLSKEKLKVFRDLIK